MAVTIIPYPNQIAVSDERRMLQESELRLQHDDRLKKEGYSLQITKTDAVPNTKTQAAMTRLTRAFILPRRVSGFCADVLVIFTISQLSENDRGGAVYAALSLRLTENGFICTVSNYSFYFMVNLCYNEKNHFTIGR